jgi:hypothetical protein
MLVLVAHAACHPARHPSGTYAILDLSDTRRFEAVPVGADRVYAERGGHPTDTQYVAYALRHQRIAMEALTCIVAPPVAVALLAEPAPLVDALFDRERRPVWVVDPGRLQRDLLVVVHEQTHRIASPVFSGLGARFIEEGLCDWVAHRVHRERAPRETCPIMQARAERLYAALEREPTKSIDLLEESERFETSKYGHSLSGVERALREESEAEDRVAITYGCALAWWLDVAERDVDAAAVVLSSRPRTRSELFAMLPAPGLVDVGEALARLSTP